MELRRRFRVRAFIALATAAQLLTIVFGVSILVHSNPTDAAQQVPYKINFQGRLSDNSGNILSDGLYNVKFRLWTLASGGSNVWEEDRVRSATDDRIQVTNGLFNIQFGDLTALSPALFVTGTGSLFLEVELPTPGTATCATNGCAVFTEGAMTPRQTLASSPYAMNSDTLDGLDSAAFGQLSAIQSWTDTNTFSKSGGAALVLSGSAASGGSILQIGSALSGGSGSGTLFGANTTSAGDLINLQVSSALKLKVDNSGSLTTAGDISYTSGANHTLSVAQAASGAGNNFTITAGQSNTGAVNGGDLVLQAGATGGSGTTGSVIVKANGTESVSAFQIQNSAAAPAFTVDTSANKVVIGDATGVNTATTLLVVDSATADPAAGYNGAQYYNSTSGKFRCYQGGTWVDCISSTITATANSTASFTSGLQNVAGTVTGAAVETLVFTSSTAVSNVAGVTGFTAPAAGSFRTCLTKNNAVITGGTLNLRWRVNGVSVGGGACTMNSTTNRQSATALDSGVVTFAGGDTIGIAYDTVGLLPAATNDFTTFWSVEYNAASGNGLTLQFIYDSSSSPATINLTNNKNLVVNAADTATDPNVLINLQCTTCSAGAGRFAIQNAGADAFVVNPNNTGISLNQDSTIAANKSLIFSSGTGGFNQTYTNSVASSAQSLSFTNTNAGAGISMQGINIATNNGTTASSGTNVLNVVNFAAGTALQASDQTNGLNFASTTGYTNFLKTPNTNLAANGDLTTAFTLLDGTTTTNGAGTAATALILTSAANFDVGNYVQINDTNCGGAGVNPCYAKITAKAVNTLTITPALTWTTGKTVNEYHLPEIGGTDLTQTLANRYGRGYFIAGVATGNGTTYYNEDSIDSSLATFNLLTSNVTTLNIGTAATTLAIGSGSTAVTIPGNLTVTGTLTAPGPSSGASGHLTRSGTTLSPTVAGDNLTTSGNISTTGSGTIASASTVTVGSFAAATSTPICSNAGVLATCNANPSGVTLQQAYAAGSTISTTGNDIAFTLNSSQGLTTTTATNTTGFTSLLRADGAGTADPAQLLLVKNLDVDRAQPIGIKVDAANTNGKITTALDVSSANITTAIALGANAITGTNFSVNSSGVITAPTATNTINGAIINAGALSGLTGVTLTSGAITTPGNISTTGTGTITSAGAITAPTATNTINGLIINAAALSNVASLTGSGALTIASGGAGALTLDSASNTTIIAANDTTLSRTASGTYTIDLVDALATTLGLTNSGAGVANLTTDGGISIGSGQTYKVNGTQIDSTALSNDANITKQGNSFNGTTQLVQTNGSGQLPALSGTNLTALNPTNLAQGSGAVTLQSANATALTLNSGTSGALNLATQATGKTIQIGQTTAAVTDIINIGNSAFAGSVNTITIGNQLTTSTTAIQGGTGASAITLTPGTNGGILATTTGTGSIEFNTATSVIVQSTTDSATTFQIQNAATSPIFNVNTVDSNPVLTSGFETNPLVNWNILTAGTIARDTTQHYVGAASGKVTAGTSAGGGVSQNLTLGLSTQYTLSFYAKLDAASPAFTTLQAGYSSTGLVGGEIDCTLNSNTVIVAGWNRYICTFTTPGTTSGTPYFYIQHSDTTSEVFYIDAVQLDTGSFATPYGSGKISLNANIDSPVNFQQASNSTTAFQITNTSGANILNVDTLNNNLNNQATNASFESGTTGWAAKTGCTLTQDATGGYNGSSSAKCVNTATANAGMNMTGIVPVMVNGTTYTVSMYVKSSANMSTLEIGRADNGAADTSCLTGQTVTSLGWKRFTCTFTAGAQSGTPYIYVKQTDAVARTIWVDAVLMETDANASTNYRDGRISLGNATISSPAVFQTNANSTTAFQIQNAAGIQVFNVDTASDTGLVTNSGFEVNSAGWSVMNGATGLVRDTSKTYVGIASGKVTTAVTASSGMRYTFAAALPGVAATAYTISAYVQTSAADATFAFGYNNGADTACVVSPAASATVPSTTGWTRFTCSTPVNTTINSIYITSGTTAVTLNVDAVRVELGATATAFGNSNISFNGVFTSPIAIRNPNDTTTEFQVQNGASANLFTVDSLNKDVIIGSATSDQTQILIQLDSYEAASNSTADTATCSATANAGAMYYNTETNAIRACVNTAWEDVVTTAGLGIMLYGVVPDSGLNPGDLPALATASVTGPCRVSWATATTVTVQPCVAYSGGRKIIVTGDATRQTMTTQSVAIPTGTANAFTHVCLTTASTSQPGTSALSATESANLPAFNISSPVLCLADVKLTAAGTAISNVYDVRTFTTTTKEYVTTTAATSLGIVVVPNTTGVSLPGGASVTARGVVVASNGAASAGGVPNAIIAVAGPVATKATGGGSAAIVQIQGVTGYTFTAVLTANIYGNLGMSRSAYPATACITTANAVNCNNSLFYNLNLR